MAASDTHMLSLFTSLQNEFGDAVSIFQATQGTLSRMSQTLVNCIADTAPPRLILAGFQKNKNWEAEKAYYTKRVGAESQLYVFATELPSTPDNNYVTVALEHNASLRQERFLLILTPTFSVILCAQDRNVPIEEEDDRLFQAFLSFQPHVLEHALRIMTSVIQHYLPNQAASFAEVQSKLSPTQPASAYLTCIINELIGHLQASNNQLSEARQERHYLREQHRHLERVVSELAVPVVPLLDGVIVLPIVGSIDTQRAQQVMESLLNGIADQQADAAIIDITGVPLVDTAVANYLVQSIRAANLLGAHVILTGIGARIAQTLVTLGVDFSHVTTRSNLRDGIEAAIALRGLQIIPLNYQKTEIG